MPGVEDLGVDFSKDLVLCSCPSNFSCFGENSGPFGGLLIIGSQASSLMVCLCVCVFCFEVRE